MATSEDRQQAALLAALRGDERPGREFGIDTERAKAIADKDRRIRDGITRNGVDVWPKPKS